MFILDDSAKSGPAMNYEIEKSLDTWLMGEFTVDEGEEFLRVRTVIHQLYKDQGNDWYTRHSYPELLRISESILRERAAAQIVQVITDRMFGYSG